jgi:tetratricopeptide (TPR) repeat protein
MSQQHSQQTLADARQLFKQKEYSEALQICKTLLTRKGPQADVLTLKALIHKQLGDLEEAGKSMDLALSQNPTHAVMLFTGALINLKLSNFDQAKKQAMKAAREAPDNPQINCQCALIVGRAGAPQRALQILEKFVQKNQGQAEVWYLIGKFQADLDNSEAAEYALRECIKLEPNHVNALKRLKRVIGPTP